MTLKELRTSKELTQKEAAAIAGISIRSYKQYENDPNKKDTFKYEYLFDVISKHNFVDETHGVLTLKQIKNKVTALFESEYKGKISFCYLFGSYAKGKAIDNSDVDLLICTDITGMKFFGIAEALRESLNKTIDLLNIEQLNNNPTLLKEILESGIKIYW